MPSPDLSGFIDLTIDDQDPQDIYDSAVLDLQTKIPNWEPREGNIEVMLIESAALEVSEVVFAINRLPGAMMMALGQMYGLYRDEGSQPTVNLTFTASDSSGYTLPAGTVAQLQFISGIDPINFSLDNDLVIAPGSSSATGSATGDRFSQDGNGTPSGTVLTTLQSYYFLSSVVTASIVANGLDPEDDSSWIARIIQRLSRQTQALVTPNQFLAFALENPLVTRCFVLDNTNTSGGVGASPGYITLAVYGAGQLLTSQQKADMAAAIDLLVSSNLVVNVIDPTLTAVAITTAVKMLPGYVAADVQSYVTAALTKYLNVSSWDFDSTVRRNSLLAVIGNAQGVDYVVSLTTPSADVSLTGLAPLATLGTVSVTAS